VTLPRAPSNATVLATGCTGFLGRHCLQELVRAGFRIHAVSRQARHSALAGVAWHEIDLMSTPAATALVAALRPTHLLHLAWIATPVCYRDAPENLEWLQTSLALLRAFGENGGRRFVGVGSASEYRAGAFPCREDESPIAPTTLYGRCKSAFWTAAQDCAQQHGFSAAWARVFMPFGPGDPPGRLIPSLVAAFSAGEPIDVTDGTQIRDFVYAPDVAALLVRLLAAPEATGAFNVGTGRGVPVRDVIAWIADRFNARDLVRFGGKPRREDEPSSLIADMSKVRRVLAWQAPTSLESGLERLIIRAKAASPELSLGRGIGSCAS
jgi:nucleoside-diphosphate-sugar epimerase